MKRMAIRVTGTESDPIDLTIKPGTTAREILADIGLAGYLLSTGYSSRFFGEDENVYMQVRDCGKLYVENSSRTHQAAPVRAPVL